MILIKAPKVGGFYFGLFFNCGLKIKSYTQLLSAVPLLNRIIESTSE